MILLLAVPALGGLTYQRWDFVNYSDGMAPNIDNNPYGTAALTAASLTHSPIFQWMQDLSGSGSVTTIEIPNSDVTDGWKWIEVTIGYGMTGAGSSFHALCCRSTIYKRTWK